MAVVISKSLAISNRDASPRVMNPPWLMAQHMREVAGAVTTGNGDSVGSLYIFQTIPSNARVCQVLIFSPDIGTTTAMDIGLYKSTDDGGTLVDADFFASAYSVSGGAQMFQDITHESTVFDVNDLEKPIWQALGLTTDPGIFYDVVGTLTGAADAAGTIGLKIRYVW